MSNKTYIDFDIAIIGAGFSGTLTALCLHQCGLEVCVIEKDRHPRFAIGESSTPIADMILRSLSDNYNLPWLRHFSRYGSWQEHYPDITCGLKRGFSYFKHKPGEPFTTNTSHENELLVAASENDMQSDTNWLRSDFDAFLVDKLKEYDITYFDKTEIKSLEREDPWRIDAKKEDKPLFIKAGFLVDATGSPKFLNTFLGIEYTADGFMTNSRALFSHFTDVQPWQDYLRENKVPTQDFPYNPDFSALHHLLKDGWMWMLRFNDDRVSAGILMDGNSDSYKNGKSKSPAARWDSFIAEYPSLKEVFNEAQLANDPGHFVETGRLQRRLLRITGSGWAALPHTAVFVDPMNSTGIAHTLSGVEKLVGILSDFPDPDRHSWMKLYKYELSILKEIGLIDFLTAGSYLSLNHFELFNPNTMLYFAAAIAYEQERLKGNIPSHYLCADDPQISNLAWDSYYTLKNISKSGISDDKIRDYYEMMKKGIEPYNTAGLLNPEKQNMYRHTAISL